MDPEEGPLLQIEFPCSWQDALPVKRQEGSLGGDIAHLSRHGAPTGPGTGRPAPSEAEQVSQGDHAAAEIPQAPGGETGRHVRTVRFGIRPGCR